MKKLLPLILIFCLLSGCAAAGGDAPLFAAAEVWRVYTGSDAGDLLQSETLPLPSGSGTELEKLIELYSGESTAADLRCALPAGVELEAWEAEKGLVTLHLSEEFLSLSPMEQSCAAFAAVLTLCASDEADAVSVAVGDTLVFQALDAEDALLQDTDSDPYSRRLRLYFADEDGTWLVSEYRSLSLDDTASLERYVMEELLRGPNDSTLRSAIPEGTRLLSCVCTDGVCTVDLSGEFVENKPATALGERLAVWSVVNSLTVLSDVDSVVLLCQGESIGRYVYRDLSQGLSAFPDANGPAAAAKGETETRLYFAGEDLDSFLAMPYAVSIGEGESTPEALLRALTDAAEPGLPRLFYGDGTILSCQSSGGRCTVDVSESFFASLGSEERMAAVKALAATLLFSGGQKSVSLTVGGKDAVFEGISYAGPWTEQDINITE